MLPLGVMLTRLSESFRGGGAGNRWDRLNDLVRANGLLYMGRVLVILGGALVLGSVIGAILWGDHGEPRTPW